jgi:hypothetical protein
MKKIFIRIANYIGIFLMVFGVMFAIFSFGNYDINPGNWSVDSRISMAVLGLILCCGVMGFVIVYENSRTVE